MRLVLIAIALFLGFSSAFAEGQNCVKLSIGGYRCDEPSSGVITSGATGATASGSSAGQQTTQQTAQPTKKEFDKNRIDVNFGVFIPRGGVSGVDFELGGNSGISYTRFLTENIGVGGFAERYAFETERAFAYVPPFSFTSGRIEVSSVLVGAQVVAQKATKDGIGYGALKIGRASATAKYNFDGLPKESYDGSGTGFIIEVGGVKKERNALDWGMSVKYQWLKVDLDDTPNTELDLSGFVLAVNLGVSF